MAFFSSTGWRGRLRDASFRGVPFSVEDDESTFGRRVQVHEYPNRDKPWTEDLGRATRRLTINAYLVGDDYADRRDRLIGAIETAGPGTLVHPQYGEMQGSIDGQVRITHSSTEGRMCRVSFQFVESGELSFPVAGMATAKRLETSGGLFDDAIDSMFSTFSLSGISDFIQNDVIADAASMLGDVADAFRMVDSGVSAAMRLLQGDLSVILMPPSAASDFVNALQKAWRSGDRLMGSTSDLVTMIKTMSGITLDPGLSPRGTWPTDSGSAAKQKMQRNMIAAAIRTTAISTAVHAVTTLKQPRDVPGVRGVNQPAGTGRDSDII
ncbi:DNA circularization N-terminal domain-containing protein, partial [Salmonella enterica]